MKTIKFNNNFYRKNSRHRMNIKHLWKRTKMSVNMYLLRIWLKFPELLCQILQQIGLLGKKLKGIS